MCMEARMDEKTIFKSTALFLMVLGGCGSPPADENAEDFSVYAALKLTFESPDEAMQTELSRIQSEKGLPQQMQAAEEQLRGADDLTAVFQGGFGSIDEINSLHTRLMRMWPKRDLDFARALPGLNSLLRDQRQPRSLLKDALRSSDSRFRLDFAHGLGTDFQWLKATEVFARMELVQIADAIDRFHPKRGIDPLNMMLRLAHKLDKAPQLIPRLQAVEVRRFALKGVQQLATDPESTEEIRETLLELLNQHLELWPDERKAWKGDRALGMHVYEMVRSGEYLSLLTDDEITDLDARRERFDRALVVTRNIDVDELYYLDTMRQVMEMSAVPFYERNETWNERFTMLDEKRNQPEFPRVAADMMFAAFTTAQQRIARDRSRCDAWRMALQQSLELPVNEAIHQVTGTPLSFDNELGVIRVIGLEPEDRDLNPVLLPAANAPEG